MTLIARQMELVQELEPILEKRLTGKGDGGAVSGMKSRVKRIFIESMIKDGYTQREAAQAAQDAEDVAWLNVSFMREAA